jgi:hypothetical protein
MKSRRLMGLIPRPEITVSYSRPAPCIAAESGHLCPSWVSRVASRRLRRSGHVRYASNTRPNRCVATKRCNVDAPHRRRLALELRRSLQAYWRGGGRIADTRDLWELAGRQRQRWRGDEGARRSNERHALCSAKTADRATDRDIVYPNLACDIPHKACRRLGLKIGLLSFHSSLVTIKSKELCHETSCISKLYYRYPDCADPSSGGVRQVPAAT